MRRALHSLLCLAVLIVACASLPHAPGVTMSPKAWVVANSTWTESNAHGREAGLCIASGRYTWGWTIDGKMWAYIEAFAEHGPQAAQIDSADELRAWWHDSVCGDSLPAWHAHLPIGVNEPSLCDQQTLAKRPKVPFHLVQHQRGIILYYISPGQHYRLANDTTQYCDQ